MEEKKRRVVEEEEEEEEVDDDLGCIIRTSCDILNNAHP